MPRKSISLQKPKTPLKSRVREAVRVGLMELTHVSGASKLIKPFYGGAGMIFMFHEITGRPKERLGQGCHVARFEAILANLANRGFEFVSLEEANRRLGEPSRTDRPFVALTFDDGYRDNIDLALPLLEHFNAPATIFVPTHAATGQLNAWWLAIRELVLAHDALEFEALGQSFCAETLAEKQALFQHVVDWVWSDFNRADALEATFRRYGIVMPHLVARFLMTTSEVQAAARHPLLSIEAHTESHRALGTLDDTEVLREMAANKAWLENILQTEVRHFAYPYGHFRKDGAREAQLAGRAGFDVALTTDPGCLFARHADRSNALLWPRENGEFNGRVQAGMSWFTSGAARAVRTRFGPRAANINMVSLEATGAAAE